MNYRHAFHAGNFADVVKHATLARIFAHLKRKETPFRFIDVHAGIGAYNLDSAEARRSPEWRQGVARLKDERPPPTVAAFLEYYLKVLGPLDAEGRPARYPGSPQIAQRMLRSQDRIALCEVHPEDREKLTVELGPDRRLSILGLDGYLALGGHLPPKERRGLVLVDPPYEATDEAERVLAAMNKALRAWPTGIYLLWRPIKSAVDDARFLRAFADINPPNALRLEIDVGGDATSEKLRRVGLLVVNPPFTLHDEARAALPWLARRLQQGPGEAGVCAWLRPPQ